MNGIDPAIVRMIDELDELAESRQDAWQVPRSEGELLHQIALASDAKLVVEVGTSYGFSGLFFGAALKRTGGRMHTIDRDPKKYDSSKLTFTKAALNEIITNHLGDAEEVLRRLRGPFDLVFLDADKPATLRYFQIVWPQIRIGGTLLIDNATTHRRDLGGVVSELRARPDAISTEMAVGNGLEWAVKIA